MEAVVRELSDAKQEILVQAYSFTSAPIAKALVDAHKKGVKVTVVLEKNRRAEKYSSANFVNNAGIPGGIYVTGCKTHRHALSNQLLGRDRIYSHP